MTRNIYLPKNAMIEYKATLEQKCIYCGAINCKFELDHIIPLSKGGLSVEENLAIACQKCNRQKGNNLLCDWLGSGCGSFTVSAMTYTNSTLKNGKRKVGRPITGRKPQITINIDPENAKWMRSRSGIESYSKIVNRLIKDKMGGHTKAPENQDVLRVG